MPLDKLLKEREEICKPDAYSEQWLEVFKEFDNDPDTIEIFKEDFMLYFLSKLDDTDSNCLHLVCKQGDIEILKKIIEVCEILSPGFEPKLYEIKC